MTSFKTFLQEAKGLTQILKHTKNANIAILTAFRGLDTDQEYTESELNKHLADNRARNKKLATEIRRAGYGFTKVKGSYPEKINGKDVRVDEESFFITDNNTNAKEHLKDLAIRLGRKYNQDSVLFKEQDGDAVLLGTNTTGYPGLGKEERLGKWHTNKVSDYFTKLKNGKKFIFEAYYHPQNFLARAKLHNLGVKQEDMNWMPLDNEK